MIAPRIALSLIALFALPLGGRAGTPEAGGFTVELAGVRSDSGTIRVSLCADPAAPFPGACLTFGAAQPARRGTTVVHLPAVPPGRYALQAFHDENDNGRAEIPPEGFAFGNDAAWPPSFEAAAVTAGGTSPGRVRLTYAGAPAAAAHGSRGAEPGAGVVRQDLRERGLYGQLYLPAEPQPRPLRPVLLIGGSEGGIATISQMAVSFAQAGYAALALAYWNEQGLPASLERIPLEYFDRGIAWLRARPGVDRRGVALVGWSRGGEGVLLVASRNPAVRVVVAVAPSSVVWEGLGANGAPAGGLTAWTAGGRDLAFVKPDVASFRADRPSLLPVFNGAMDEADRLPEAAIPVERIRGDLLLISGGDDALWPTQRFTDRIVARLQGAGFRYRLERLDYPDAGHFVFVGAPDGPMARNAVAGGMMGGTPQANAAAWADNWPRTRAFIDAAFEGK